MVCCCGLLLAVKAQAIFCLGIPPAVSTNARKYLSRQKPVQKVPKTHTPGCEKCPLCRPNYTEDLEVRKCGRDLMAITSSCIEGKAIKASAPSLVFFLILLSSSFV